MYRQVLIDWLIDKVPICQVCYVAGQQQQFRALALGQRPYIESPFASHLRELESFRRKTDSSGYKLPSPGPPAQGKTNFSYYIVHLSFRSPHSRSWLQKMMFFFDRIKRFFKKKSTTSYLYSVRGLDWSELGGSHGCPGRLWARRLWQVYSPSKASCLLSIW